MCSSGDTPYAATHEAEVVKLSHHFDYMFSSSTAQHNSSSELLGGEQHEKMKRSLLAPKIKYKQEPTALDPTHLREHKLQKPLSKKG